MKKTFFDGMLRLHPLLRIPGYTLNKLGICLSGLSLRAREVAKFEHPGRLTPIRADFWLIRAWIVIEFAACLATGHIVAWLVQFILTLWVNTFLVVASHDFEESAPEAELAVIPDPLRDDWAARQICLSYDLSVVGNRWIDLFLSAGLSPHRVHHVLPYQGSGFANLVSEDAVRKVCAEAGIAWARPRNLIFDRFPAVMRHYLLCPVKALPPPPLPAQPPPPPPFAMRTPPPSPSRRAASSAESARRAASSAEFVPRAASCAETAARVSWFIRQAPDRGALPLHGRRVERSRRVTAGRRRPAAGLHDWPPRPGRMG